MEVLSFLSLLYFLMILLTKYCIANNTLTQSQRLSVNQSLVSAGEIFELGFFSAGNNNSREVYIGLWYKNIRDCRILWVANRENPLEANDPASSLTVGSDGNLRLVDGRKRKVWSTNATVQSDCNTTAVLTDKGELILKESASGVILWNSFNFLGDTIISGMKLGYDLSSGVNLQMLSWKSNDDPSPGNFRLGFSYETPPQGFTWSNESRPYWRSGPWNGWKFVGIPESDSGYSNGMSLVQDNQQGRAYFNFNSFNKSYVTIFVLKPSGLLKIVLWDDEKNAWRLNWKDPRHLCDVYGTCGPFSVCNQNKAPFCECLRGFVPESSEEWSKGNWTSGCKRRTQLLCEQNSSLTSSNRSNNDGFLKLTEMKLPDHYMFLYDQDSIGCREWCLNTCSCAAYAYPQGIGCMVWASPLIDVLQFSFAGEDLYLRLASSEFGEDNKRKIKLLVVSTIVASSIVFGISAYMICRWRTNRKGGRKRARGVSSYIELPIDSSELPMISFDELAAATNNFSDNNKLGRGGFGSVYKGILANGQEIAVKRLCSHSGQGVEEFKNEILLISKLQHRNLVRLLGCSIHGDEKLLVYELMKNKSLDYFLFDETKRLQLDWVKRFNIIQGIARGLLYLHRDSCLRIIHRDLNVSNILLDIDLNPKISDFGLARAFRVTEELTNTHRVVGTFGYMSPEYVIGGRFSEKSDVYSFGVLLLEIVSGRRNSDFYNPEKHSSLLSYAWKLWAENREVDLIDESISESSCFEEMVRCIGIGLLCVQDHASDRPTMSNVVQMLCSETLIDIPQPKQPTFTVQSLLDSNPRSQSNNEVTISMIDGR